MVCDAIVTYPVNFGEGPTQAMLEYQLEYAAEDNHICIP